MNDALTFQDRVYDLRLSRKLSLEELASQTGLSKAVLSRYEQDDDLKDPSARVIQKLAKFYGVSTDYLLGLTENKNHPNTALSELHLSDEMVDLLKSGKINNRLLCELALHPEFPKLIADLEIYIDGMVTTQIQSINAVLEALRIKIIEQSHPEEDNVLRTLKAAQIPEDAYFARVVSDDVEYIIRDLKEKHKSDNTSASVESTVAQFKAEVEELEKAEASRAEKWMMLFCKQTGINYRELTDEDKKALVRICSKSKHMKTPINQRGKKR